MAEERPGLVDLRGLDLASGAGTRLALEVAVDDLWIGGQAYRVGGGAPVPLRLDASRSPSGWLFRLSLSTDVAGPCFRCLARAAVRLDVDTREFAATGRDGDAAFDEDLDSEYLHGERLDAPSWVRDAIVEALPDVIVCREDCAGICPACGRNLNEGPCDCPPAEEADPRWGPLAALAERLREERADGGD